MNLAMVWLQAITNPNNLWKKVHVQVYKTTE